MPLCAASIAGISYELVYATALAHTYASVLICLHAGALLCASALMLWHLYAGVL
jgi:hypothetical protein